MCAEGSRGKVRPYVPSVLRWLYFPRTDPGQRALVKPGVSREGSRAHSAPGFVPPGPGASPHLRLAVEVLPLPGHGVSGLVGLCVPAVQGVFPCPLQVPQSLQGPRQ